MKRSTVSICSSTVALCGLLTACAAPIPAPTVDAAVVQVYQTQTLDHMLGEKVDGQTTQDGRFFSVTPGPHVLNVLIEHDSNNDNQNQACFADIKYDGFKAGHTYRIDESSRGEQVSAVMLTQDGKPVSQAVGLNCIPG